MRTLLIQGEKQFKIVIADDDQVTFGPFSPPVKGQSYGNGDKRGTLRVYRGGKQNIVACFAGVESFRDLSLEYSELVAREEGAAMWKSDTNGYVREEKLNVQREWVSGNPANIVAVNANTADAVNIAPGKAKRKVR